MLFTNSLDKNLFLIKSRLKVNESYDLHERIIDVHNTKFYMYYVEGFTKDSNFEYVRRDMYNVKKETFDSIKTAKDLIEKAISSVEASLESDVDMAITNVLAGKTMLIGMNFNQAIILDLKQYPHRSVEEPEKEKVLRGSHDGFGEMIVQNTALIRRRLRNKNLVFEMYKVGSATKTDVSIGYLDNKVNKKTLEKIKKYITELNVNSLTLGDQSLVEVVRNKSWVNPYPTVRYTERPDVVASQLLEGDVVVLIDNTPSVLILPSSIFSFFQSVDDYYMPVSTGNYLKFVRVIVLLFNIFLTPVFVLLMDNVNWISSDYAYLLPKDPVNVPIFMQFIIMEIAVDGLKIASLNTPSSLGTSLSIIGGLILGDFAVKTGWFIPQTIFYMAIVALSSFVQPSIEFSYALKFSRIAMLFLTGVFGVWGFIAGIALDIIVIATTKTFGGESYLYPLIPFNWKALKHVIFRCKKDVNED